MKNYRQSLEAIIEHFLVRTDKIQPDFQGNVRASSKGN